jgi:hypothetical protein
LSDTTTLGEVEDMRIEFLNQFEHLGFFAAWLALALALGFALFYVWDKLHRRWERQQAAGDVET